MLLVHSSGSLLYNVLVSIVSDLDDDFGHLGFPGVVRMDRRVDDGHLLEPRFSVVNSGISSGTALKICTNSSCFSCSAQEAGRVWL